jgi:hypothetical protein
MPKKQTKRPSGEFDFAASFEGYGLRRIAEIMDGLWCVYCLTPVAPESDPIRHGKLAVCSIDCAFNAMATHQKPWHVQEVQSA